jgi:hypothetical protein
LIDFYEIICYNIFKEGDKVKYCLSARQPITMLKKADEIKIDLRDFRAIPEYMEKYPTKTLILVMENELPSDFAWEEIETYAKAHMDFHVAISNRNQASDCSLRGIKFYYKYAATTFYELDALQEMGVSYLVIAAPLTFDLQTVKRYGIPVRAVPNLAYEPYLLHKDGLVGGWIRPEDVEQYGEYIDVLEFYAPRGLDHEAALWRVYAEKKLWNSNLNQLIEYLNVDITSPALAADFAEMRMNCKQRSVSHKTCRYCHEQVKFIQAVKKYNAEKGLI